MSRVIRVVKKAAVSFCVSAGVLSIANVETIWREQQHRDDYESVRHEVRATLTARLAPPKSGRAGSPGDAGRTADLRASLVNVELGSLNPFSQITNLDPLNAVLAKGVVDFQRQAYRGPNYKEESGYDLVEYRITHADQSTSTILAYLEQTLEGPDQVPVVLLVRAGIDNATTTLYRGGQLTESQDVAWSVAQGMVSRRLNAGIPFLSVAR